MSVLSCAICVQTQSSPESALSEYKNASAKTRAFMENHYIHTFENGLRLIHREVPHTNIAHCGIMLDIGSRDEQLEQQGIAHFWEHMAFKGTEKRRAFHVINRLETVGGDLNAYTTKEKICFHASLLSAHFEKAVDLLTDITFNSSFPEREIKKERSVILEEMAMYEDDPADAIQDDFDALLFGEHPLGRNILGTRDSVTRFGKSDFQKFISGHLNTSRAVISSVSNWPFSKVLRVVRKYVEGIPAQSNPLHREPFAGKPLESQEKSRSISQAHCILGGIAYPLLDEKRLPFAMLMNLLGGPGMNARLNMAIRERNGLAYSIFAHYAAFLDTGMFAIQFASEPQALQRCLDLTRKELKKLRERPLGKVQLHTAKQQFMGQIAMAEESNLNMMLGLAKSLLDTQKIDSLEEVFHKIERTTAADLQEMAHEVLGEDRLSQLTFLPNGE